MRLSDSSSLAGISRHTLSFIVLLSMVGVFAFANPARACGGYGSVEPWLAISEDATIADAAIQRLRDEGPRGLALMMTIHRNALDALADGTGDPNTAENQRLIEAMRRVAAQKDAHFSGLYWYTDLSQARAAANETGKPLLALCLLGRLDESLSCANSRFFRTVLYPDPLVAERLREHFVLYWHTVLPAPRLTVDLGDGRTIERTITGNSMHVVMNADGRVLDAMPGLVSAELFAEWLTEARDGFAADAVPTTPETYDVASAIIALGYEPEEAARVAMERTRGKMILEMPIFNEGLVAHRVPINLQLDGRNLATHSLIRRIDRAQPISAVDQHGLTGTSYLMVEDTTLSPNSLRIIENQTPNVTDEQRDAMIHQFRRTLIADTAMNRVQLQPVVRRWLSERDAKLHDAIPWIYAEIFATPLNDPWMGLDTPGVYTGLENSGLIEPMTLFLGC